MIGDAGYDVIEADNADEAIAILEGRSDIGSQISDMVRVALGATYLFACRRSTCMSNACSIRRGKTNIG
jgi:hypothetical protein